MSSHILHFSTSIRTFLAGTFYFFILMVFNLSSLTFLCHVQCIRLHFAVFHIHKHNSMKESMLRICKDVDLNSIAVNMATQKNKKATEIEAPLI